MPLVESFRFAALALLGHRRRSALALLGVAIGVFAVIMLTSLGEGARRYVTNQFAELGTNLVIVLPGKNETTGFFPGVAGAPHDLSLEDAQALQRGIPHLRELAPLSLGNETVAFRERSRQVIVLGSTTGLLDVRDLSIAAGQFLPDVPMDRGASVVVLGSKIARELFLEANPVGQVARIGDWRMRVIGVLAPRGMHMGLDMNEIVVVPVATGMRMFDQTSLFRILMKVGAHGDIEAVKARALTILTERHTEEDVTIWTQDSVMGALSDILGKLTLALVGIAAISLTVAGIGIMNVMLVSVSGRTREIGLLRSIGAGKRQVLGVFLAEAVLLSASGGLFGLLLAWLAVFAFGKFYPDFPAAAPAWAIGAAIAVSIGVGALFGFLPARKATLLDPVAALARR